MVFVASETSLEAPPMMPARARGPSVPATTPQRAPSFRSTSSRVWSSSPSFAHRMFSRPEGIRVRSKAWDGCPISSMT